MEKNTSKKPFGFSKLIVYICLILLAITIIVPVAWVFLASVKQNKEFYGNPWTLPEKLYFQNFVDAWTKADMGSYILNSVIVTALAIAMLIAVALPAAYVLSRFKFRTCKFWNLLFMAGLFINVSYIVVPIFLMLNNWDKSLRQMIGRGFFLNNLFILAVVYMQRHFRSQSTCCQDTSVVLQKTSRKQLMWMVQDTLRQWLRSSSRWQNQVS